MTDINKVFHRELKARRAKNIFAPSENSPEEGKVTHARISIDETNEETLLNAKYGPQQVKSLLSLVLDYPLTKQMSDAGDDADAVHHLNRLNSHRG